MDAPIFLTETFSVYRVECVDADAKVAEVELRSDALVGQPIIIRGPLAIVRSVQPGDKYVGRFELVHRQ